MIVEEIEFLMHQALEESVFPGGALLFAKSGRILFHKVYGDANIFTGQPLCENTIFDLASLTKPLATALAFMSLVQDKKISLDQSLGSVIDQFKNTPKEDIRIRNILCHNSGLPAYQPYYLKLSQLPYRKRKDALKKFLLEEPILTEPEKGSQYSDIGFMMLEWMIEAITGISLDRFVSQTIYQPLNIRELFYVDLNKVHVEQEFAATEICPWRKCLLNGAVHDENAYSIGGIAGHAGLFGSMDSVYKLLSILMDAYQGHAQVDVFEKDLVHLFFERQKNSDRALGFDMPSETNSSCGHLFHKHKTVGHLGFTGTSFWMDLDQSIIIILLTNRVHPSRNNEKIKKFRPILHDAIMNHIITSS